MNAKEMFEKLDWVFDREDEGTIVYRQNAYRLMMYKRIYEFKVFYTDSNNAEHSGFIDMPLILAIHKQMKELGWIDEN